MLCLMEKLLRDPSFPARRWAELRGAVIKLEGAAVHCHLALCISRGAGTADSPKSMLGTWHVFLFVNFNKSNRMLPVAT